MTEYLFQLPDHKRGTLQARIQEMIVNSILEGHLALDTPLPSSRKLARQLSVARNTVVYAYQTLVDEGFLIARERSGFYVNADILKGRVESPRQDRLFESRIDWKQKFCVFPGDFRQNVKPTNWLEKCVKGESRSEGSKRDSTRVRR